MRKLIVVAILGIVSLIIFGCSSNSDTPREGIPSISAVPSYIYQAPRGDGIEILDDTTVRIIESDTTINITDYFIELYDASTAKIVSDGSYFITENLILLAVEAEYISDNSSVDLYFFYNVTDNRFIGLVTGDESYSYIKEGNFLVTVLNDTVIVSIHERDGEGMGAFAVTLYSDGGLIQSYGSEFALSYETIITPDEGDYFFANFNILTGFVDIYSITNDGISPVRSELPIIYIKEEHYDMPIFEFIGIDYRGNQFELVYDVGIMITEESKKFGEYTLNYVNETIEIRKSGIGVLYRFDINDFMQTDDVSFVVGALTEIENGIIDVYMFSSGGYYEKWDKEYSFYINLNNGVIITENKGTNLYHDADPEKHYFLPLRYQLSFDKNSYSVLGNLVATATWEGEDTVYIFKTADEIVFMKSSDIIEILKEKK